MGVYTPCKIANYPQSIKHVILFYSNNVSLVEKAPRQPAIPASEIMQKNGIRNQNFTMVPERQGTQFSKH